MQQPVDPNAKKPITRAQHYEQLKKSGIVKPDYELPPFPDKLRYLWNWYCELTWQSFAATEIKAHFELKGIELMPWEYDLLLRLDRESRKL